MDLLSKHLFTNPSSGHQRISECPVWNLQNQLLLNHYFTIGIYGVFGMTAYVYLPIDHPRRSGGV
jgi:hypothetical protein